MTNSKIASIELPTSKSCSEKSFKEHSLLKSLISQTIASNFTNFLNQNHSRYTVE